jgi:hypothetical protein
MSATPSRTGPPSAAACSIGRPDVRPARDPGPGSAAPEGRPDPQRGGAQRDNSSGKGSQRVARRSAPNGSHTCMHSRICNQACSRIPSPADPGGDRTPAGPSADRAESPSGAATRLGATVDGGAPGVGASDRGVPRVLRRRGGRPGSCTCGPCAGSRPVGRRRRFCQGRQCAGPAAEGEGVRGRRPAGAFRHHAPGTAGGHPGRRPGAGLGSCCLGDGPGVLATHPAPPA